MLFRLLKIFTHHPKKAKGTHSKTAMLKGFCRVPRYSPIICLERPLRVMRKRATPCGELSRKPRRMRWLTPRSGFLLKRLRPTRYCRLRTVSDTLNSDACDSASARSCTCCVCSDAADSCATPAPPPLVDTGAADSSGDCNRHMTTDECLPEISAAATSAQWKVCTANLIGARVRGGGHSLVLRAPMRFAL